MFVVLEIQTNQLASAFGMAARIDLKAIDHE
jgi:hypothetical protein